MGKKVLILATLTAFLAVVFGAGLLMAADSPENVTIHEEKFGEYKKGPVEFTHGKHAKEHGVACAQCHHKYDGGQNVWKEGDPVEKCSACHDVKEKKGNVDKLQNAFHKNCKDCHKELGKGPHKKCNECHSEK